MSAALVAAETMLALTPIVIKTTPLDPVSVIWSRVLSSTALGFALTSDRTLTHREIPGFIALGGTNLLHIASSYESFRNLPVGQAMSLLYTYPMWTLLLGYMFSNVPIRLHEFGLMGLATVGAMLLLSGDNSSSPNSQWGIFNGIVMALTEAGTHTLVRNNDWKDPSKSVWIVNLSAALWFGGALGLQELFGHEPAHASNATTMDAVLLTAFNSISTFGGYWLRFYAVPRISVPLYAMLSYAGLLASFVFGLLFFGERPSWLALLGALFIVVSGVFLQMYEQKQE